MFLYISKVFHLGPLKDFFPSGFQNMFFLFFSDVGILFFLLFIFAKPLQFFSGPFLTCYWFLILTQVIMSSYIVLLLRNADVYMFFSVVLGLEYLLPVNCIQIFFAFLPMYVLWL